MRVRKLALLQALLNGPKGSGHAAQGTHDKELINLEYDYETVKNGVGIYENGEDVFFGIKRPDGSMEIMSPCKNSSISAELQEKIYKDLIEYEGPAPLRYTGPYQMGPLKYGHVEKGGPEENTGSAEYEGTPFKDVDPVSWAFHKVKKFLSGE